MNDAFRQHLSEQLDAIRAAGTYKQERILLSPQDAHIRVGQGREVLEPVRE